MLLTDIEARRWREFGGELKPERPSSSAEQHRELFLGVRYALVCWLDELFILHSPWASQWNERKLEVSLYQTNDRAWRFWQQVRLAEQQPTTDALEVFYLCVMLGFRGDLLDQPDQLQSWYKGAQMQLSQVGQDWPHPPELEPSTHVPPLRGQDWFQTMLFWTCVLLLILVPVASFLIMQRLSE
jgi:type VI secretion system protein ImpK